MTVKTGVQTHRPWGAETNSQQSVLTNSQQSAATNSPQDQNLLPYRPRRLRSSAPLRESVAETVVRASDLILPFFLIPGEGEEPIASMPGVSRLGLKGFLHGLERALNLGVRSVMLFGVLPDSAKDERGSSAADPEGPVPTALRAARAAFGNDVVLYSDVCLCAHTSHGHCGLLKETPRGVIIDNDASLPELARMALTHAEAGVDFVSPSDMMDGRVGYIRRALDAAGQTEVGILAYAVKYASAFYGPFREAAHSAPSFGDRATYQMDPRNAREALREAALDEAEGADFLMVKPILPYLDILTRLRPQTHLPLVAYQVSGEYAMLKAAVQAGVLEEPRAVRETLQAIKRAGADLIITYYALQALEGEWL
ncbi:porphobilinogen synthase [Meiothermus granaticius]|uniref:Delta-aminolevulinic acid dehydratase n=1 Tax=Meiothermus granaticius NBRC 107808 TaxID=1227551 RepID=A0A399FC59_9DEIN|nr:porphobilinogen synthase [Meiothermus granaticius]MCL6525676.1 porphobilinogen synthase [Thermaceae bacterium]RIH93783.1 Delta-aminolevulinic acid dehydratase [Meiothermus granaticius NBRC 107808]GEM85694.1 delta-aminolevulinic acid dehydratase [Meiothermus granaticius NBRC 107808]